MKMLTKFAVPFTVWLITMVIVILQVKSEMFPSGDSGAVEDALNTVGWLIILVIVAALVAIFVAGPVWLVMRVFLKASAARPTRESER